MSSREPALMLSRPQSRSAVLCQTQGLIQELALSSLPFSEKLRALMRALRTLVPAETVNLGTIDFATREGSYYALDGFLMPPQRRALLPLFVDDHPMLSAARQRRDQPPLRFSDFYSRREFEEQPIYCECYRGYTHSMLTFNVPSPRGVNVSFALSRDAGEFSDEDRDMLALVQPLIVLFMENALLRAALETGAGGRRSTGVVLGSGPQVQHLNAEAERLFERYFPEHPKHFLPDALVRAVTEQPVKPLILHRGPCRSLEARMGGNFAAWTIALTECETQAGRSSLTQAGLTGREIEVLEWVEQGKGNADIGIILGISPRTVEKHLERIFTKLGVESRQAAGRYFRDSIRV